MDEHTEQARQRIGQMAAAMAKAGVGLLALPLTELPPIATVRVRHDVDEGLRVELQLGGFTETTAALCAWADALPEPAVTGREYESYFYLEVAGVLDGVLVAVWDHLKGHGLVDAGCFLSVPLGGRSHLLPLGAVRELAERRKDTTDA